MKIIKTAIIGFGLSGSSFHAPFIRALDEFELAAIVVRHTAVVQEKMPNTPVYSTIGEMLDEQPDVELVIISTPTHTHFEMAKTAITAGKHVIIEKPYVATEEEGRELVRLAEENQVVLTVYQNRRWDGDYLTVRKLIESGRLGDIHSVEMNWDRYRKEVRDRWKEEPLPGSGVFYDLSPHMIDQSLQLFGKPEAVYARLQKQREGAKTTDSFFLMLEYENKNVLIRGGSLVAGETPRFVIHGSKGSFILFGVDPQEDRLTSGILPTEARFTEPDPSRRCIFTNPDGSTEEMVLAEGNYSAFFLQMARAIREGAPAPVNPSDGADVIRIIEKGIESSKEKKIISFE